MKQLAGIIALATLVLSPTLAAARKGTWNFDGTCSGYPEEECSFVFLAESWGEADLASCTTAIAEARKLPFPAQIALASTKPRLSPIELVSDSLHVQLNLPAAWISSGVWTEDGSVLLVDSWRGELLRLSGSGLETVDLGEHALRASDLRATERGFILKLRDGRFVTLDRQGKLTGIPKLLTSEEGEAGVQSLFNWVPVGDSVLAFGDILNPGSIWTSGWLYMSLHSPVSFNILRPMPATAPARKLYQLGYPYAASIGSTGYFLTMDGAQPHLLRVSRTSGRIQQRELALPLELLLASEIHTSLPIGGEPAGIVARYQILEKSFVLAGLYSQGSNLYLLVRRPAGLPGMTEWELVQLDPESGRVLGTVSLPTQAKHLLVIPGKELWAVIEKGSVRAPGAQDVEGLILIPTHRIEARSGKDRKLRNGNSLSVQVEEPSQGELGSR